MKDEVKKFICLSLSLARVSPNLDYAGIIFENMGSSEECN